MRIYSLELTLNSPTIMTERSDDNLLTTNSYIAGSVIRGAFITALKNNGIDIIKDEMTNPSLIFHPAFPYNDGVVLKPAHPFIYKCKICGDIKDNNPYEIISSDYSFDLDKIKRYECNKGHLFSLKSIGGQLYIPKSNKSKSGDNKYVILDSIGINRKIESVEINMLYKYVALAPHQRFKGLMVVNGNKDSDITTIEKIHIGRGISRGFGEVSVKIEEITEEYIKKRRKLISSLDRVVIFKALSPIFDLDENFKFRIEGIKDIAKSGERIVSGYSMLGNIPKIRINAIKEGSLLLFNKDNIDLLIEKELKGIGRFSSIGLNIVEVLPNDSS